MIILLYGKYLKSPLVNLKNNGSEKTSESEEL